MPEEGSSDGGNALWDRVSQLAGALNQPGTLPQEVLASDYLYEEECDVEAFHALLAQMLDFGTHAYVLLTGADVLEEGALGQGNALADAASTDTRRTHETLYNLNYGLSKLSEQARVQILGEDSTLAASLVLPALNVYVPHELAIVSLCSESFSNPNPLDFYLPPPQTKQNAAEGVLYFIAIGCKPFKYIIFIRLIIFNKYYKFLQYPPPTLGNFVVDFL